jgi:putative peptidoglycan binding protein
MNMIMKMFFVLTGCLALASVAPGAEENKPAPKKKAAPTHAAQGSQHAVAPTAHPTGHPAQHAQHAVVPAGHPSQHAQHAVVPAGHPSQHAQHAVVPAGHPSQHAQHAITPAANARLQTQHNVSTAPSRGASHGQANAQRFQARHFNLATKPNPSIASARFRANNQIQGSRNWQGQHYQAFRAYRSQWHDRGWWGSRYNRIGLFGGGYYYWNNGFWYPAWGYDPGYSYYPYDGPIYGYNSLPPDQVVANVQTALQEQGYYHGEADGLLGPLTRAAIADYQRDHGLYITSAVDEPTLASLGMT